METNEDKSDWKRPRKLFYFILHFDVLVFVNGLLFEVRKS